jgi:hypothetical protein
MFAWVGEWSGSVQGDVSSFQNFEAQGPTGAIYASTSDEPDTDDPLLGSKSISAWARNTGWIGFQVPAVTATYTILWNENQAIPYTPVAQLHVIVNAGSAGGSAAGGAQPAPTDPPVYGPPPSNNPPPQTCVPTEGDNDNDDHGLPAASWDHDGCP